MGIMVTIIMNINRKIEVIYNKIYLLLEKLLRISANTIIFFLMARTYSPEEFGEYNYLISLFLIFAAFSTYGFESYLVKVFIEKKFNIKDVLSVAVISRSVTLLFFSFFLILYLYHSGKSSLILITLLLMPFSAFDVFEYYFQSKKNFKLISVIKISVLVLLSSFKLYWISINGDIEYIFLIYFVDFFLSFLIFYLFFKKSSGTPSSKFDISVFKSLFSQTWPLIPSSIALILYMKSDIVMIEAILGSSAVATYSTATKVIEAFYFIAQITMTVAIPTLVTFRNENKRAYIATLRKTLRELLVFASISVLFIILFSNFISERVLDNKYPYFLNVLYTYIPVVFLVYFRVFLTRFLHVENLVKCSLLLHGSTAIINIILNYILIHQFGVVGAALATVISYVLSFFIVFFYYKKLRLKIYRVFK